MVHVVNRFLNRGNHEDAGICCVFGFMKECLGVYDEITFSMFVEVFRYLPLATVINHQVQTDKTDRKIDR